jgi:hypothetical protein
MRQRDQHIDTTVKEWRDSLKVGGGGLKVSHFKFAIGFPVCDDGYYRCPQRDHSYTRSGTECSEYLFRKGSVVAIIFISDLQVCILDLAINRS